MIHYKESYMTPNIVDYEKIADFLNIDVEDQEVWEIARESQEIPLFENIYQSILLSRISHTLNEEYGLQTDYFINGMDTHLYLYDGGYSKIYQLEDILEYIEVEEV